MLLVRRKEMENAGECDVDWIQLTRNETGWGLLWTRQWSAVHKRRVMSWPSELLSLHSTTTWKWKRRRSIANEGTISDRKWTVHWVRINMVCGVQGVLTCTVLSYADVYTTVSGSSRPHELRKFQTPAKWSVRPFLRQISSNLWHEQRQLPSSLLTHHAVWQTAPAIRCNLLAALSGRKRSKWQVSGLFAVLAPVYQSSWCLIPKERYVTINAMVTQTLTRVFRITMWWCHRSRAFGKKHDLYCLSRHLLKALNCTQVFRTADHDIWDEEGADVLIASYLSSSLTLLCAQNCVSK